MDLSGAQHFIEISLNENCCLSTHNYADYLSTDTLQIDNYIYMALFMNLHFDWSN